MKELLSEMKGKPSATAGIILGVCICVTVMREMADRMIPRGERSPASESVSKDYVDMRISDLNEKSVLRNTEAVALLKSLNDRVDQQTAALKVLSDRVYDLARSRRASFVLGQ